MVKVIKLLMIYDAQNCHATENPVYMYECVYHLVYHVLRRSATSVIDVSADHLLALTLVVEEICEYLFIF